MRAYAGAARRRVHLATVLLRPPSGHRPGRRQARHARILRDESVAQEYKRELAERLGGPNDSDDPEKLWTDFKAKVLKVSESCL